MEQHWHGDVSENNMLLRERHKCFYGEDALPEGRIWLWREADSERQFYDSINAKPIQGSWADLLRLITTYKGDTEGETWEILVPTRRPSKSITMGFRLMVIDGTCEEML